MRVVGTLALQSGDVTPPTVPQNVVATAINAGRVDVSWTASTDDFAVQGYQIFRNGLPLNTTSGTTYSDTTCQPSTLYSYAIVAFDFSGNSSAQSSAGNATTPANAAPVWQTIPAQTIIVGNAFLLLLTDYCTDADLDTITFSITNGTLPTGLVLSGSRIQGTPTTAGQSPTITVQAADAFHQITTTIAFAIKSPDLTAPPVPTGLAATVISSSQINLSWNASTDAAGGANEFVSGTQDYRLYRNGSLRTTTSSLSFQDTGLVASTAYSYQITARDIALNESAQSSAVNATTGSVTGLSVSLSRGVPTLLTSLGGAGRIYIMWDRPTQNTDNSLLRDLQCFEISAGSAPGLSDIVNSYRFTSITGGKGATECRIDGPNIGQTVYVRVYAVNWAGRRSAASPEFSFVAFDPTPRTRNFTGRHIAAGAVAPTISSSGDWILDGDVTGPISCNLPGVLVYQNGHNVNHSGASHGYLIGSGATNMEIDGGGGTIQHSGTGAGRNIAFSSTTAPAGFRAHDMNLTITVSPQVAVGHSANDTSIGLNLNGARFYSFSGNLFPSNNQSNTINQGCAFFYNAGNARIYDFTTTHGNCGRDGFMAACNNLEVWSFTSTLNGGLNALWYITYNNGFVNHYIHDFTINIAPGCDHCRIFTIDRVYGNVITWGHFDVTATVTDISGLLSVRGAESLYNWYGYITWDFHNLGGGLIYALRVGGTEVSGVPVDQCMYGCTGVNDLGQSVLFYETWTGVCDTFGNSFTKVGFGTPSIPTGGTWHSNQDTWNSGIIINYNNGMQGTWTGFQSFTLSQIGGSPGGNVTIPSVWTGYNPNILTPKAPTTITAVTGAL